MKYLVQAKLSSSIVLAFQKLPFLKYLVLFCFLFNFNLAFCKSLNELPSTEAFKLNVQLTQTDSVIVQWDIAPGYYLYQNKIAFTIEPANLTMGQYQFPLAKIKQDPIEGTTKVFTDKVTIGLPILNPEQKNFNLIIHYQGCSSIGTCYPPIETVASIHPSLNQVVLNSKSVDLNKKNILSSDFPQEITFLSLGLFFGFGFLLSFTPCVLPMLPILSSLILGQNKTNSIRKGFLLSLSYVLSLSATWGFTGFMFAYFGESLQVYFQKPMFILFFAFVYIVLAISMFGFFSLKIPGKIQHYINKLTQKITGGTYIGVIFMGILATLIASPCVTPPVAAALLYITKSGNAWLGSLSLFIMGLGMGTPLLLFGSSLSYVLPKSGPWLRNINSALGFILLGMAIWFLERITSSSIVIACWGGWFILIALSIFSVIKSKNFSSTFKKYLSYSFALLIMIYGLFLIIGVFINYYHNNILEKLAPRARFILYEKKNDFIIVTKINYLNEILKEAKQKKQPVLIDFYADWCVSCLSMDREIFTNPDVKKYLKNLLLIRIDITKNEIEQQKIMQQYQVFAPPTIILINKNGDIIPLKIIGTIQKSDFIKSILSIK